MNCIGFVQIGETFMLYSEMLFTLVQFYLAWFILIVVLNMPFFDKMSKRAQSRFFLICAIVHAVCAIGYFEINENKLNYIKTIQLTNH